MPLIRVSSAELSSSGSQLRSAADQIRDTNSRAMNIANSTAGVWEGEAKAQFDQLFARWQNGARQMQEGLDGISTLIQQAATSYESAEQQIKSSFNG